jgi:uncharacterized DUF497 family protein
MIVWDEKKNEWLKKERGVSFTEVEEVIETEKYLDRIENPAREGQFLFVVFLHDYVWIVPFVVDAEKNIFLKTIYQSRKYHRLYRRQI